MADVLSAALGYLAAGYSIIPIGAEKRPCLAAWKPYQGAPPDEAQARVWWGVSRPPGIAAVCGAVSGGLELLDFDHDPYATYMAWRQLVAQEWAAVLPRVCVVRTPRPGYHVWLRCGDLEIPGNRVLARAGKDVLIETRGEGGYALLPDCPAWCHPSRGLYTHHDGCTLEQLPSLSIDEREFLLACARSQDRAAPDPEPVPKSRAGADLRPGDDFDRRGWDWGQILEPHGWALAGGSPGGERRWRRPGKGRGWSATTGHCHSDGCDLLRVFSSNADPFEEGKAYGKFRAFSLLNCGGDLARAAKDLVKHGFGTKAKNGTTSNGRASESPPPDLTPDPWPAAPGRAAFHGLAGDVALAIDPETEAAPVAVLAQFLTAFGSACGRHGFRYVGARRHYPNLFMVLVGASSRGRKGTAWDWIENLFKEADPEWSASCIQAGLSSGEGLISALRDPRYVRERLRPGADAQEVCADAGAQDKRLLVVEEEFGSTLRVMNRDGNILSAVLRQAWDGGRLRTLTKNNPLRATDAHVSILGHVTRPELLRLLTQTDCANGFANRIIWLAVRRSKLLPDGGRFPASWAQAAARLREALRVARNAGRMERSAGAGALWRHHYPRLTAERPGALGLVTSRAEAQTLRLSVLYALLDGSDEIAESHLSAALALWDYAERSCRWIFGVSTGNADADEIFSALRLAADAGMTGREIHALFNNHRTTQQVKLALAVLTDGGMVRGTSVPTPGRPVQKWFATCEQSAQSEQTSPQRTYSESSC